MRFTIVAALAILATTSSSGPAQYPAEMPLPAAFDQEAGFRAFLDGLRARAQAAGVSAATLDAVMPTLSFNPRVIELDRAQPGGNPNAPASAIPAFAPYKARHVDAERINRGRASAIRQLRPRLARSSAKPACPNRS